MTAPTAMELTGPQSPEHASDVLLRHYQEIGISAVVAALNVIAEAARSENVQSVTEANIAEPRFLEPDDLAA
jgi:hypothetical protein